jgi:predicted ATPase/class 3 adenylate cyclase
MKFCGECAAPLASTCPSCGAANPPENKFCGQCAAPLRTALTAPSAAPESHTPKHLAEKILTSKAALEGERKQVTVLFADLKGSMELLADRDPEEARKLLDPVLERMMEAVHRYEGTVNQVMGDGIMALFGAPVAHEDHAVRACYAALDMQAAIGRDAERVRRSHGISLEIRVGLNSGEVVVRAIGSDLHMDYTAVGQTTHLAARMEQLATGGRSLLTAGTLRLAEGYVEAKPLGPVPVKGLDAPVEVFELTGAGPLRSRLRVAAARGLTKFVGRDSEFEQLRRALSRTASGHGQVVTIVGEPGVGKSRLVWELTHFHQTHGWVIVQGGSVSYGKATPYLPVIDLLKGYFQVADHDDHRKIHEKVLGKLLTLDEGLRPVLPSVLALLDVSVEDAEWLLLDPPQRRQRTLDAVKRMVLRESQLQPLLVVFEDLHWIDSETQALLDGLVESIPAARLLLLVNYRPEYRHEWGSKTYYTQLRLDPLPPESAEALLDVLLGPDPTFGDVRRLLTARTQGNPFFLEESVRSLVETGALVGDRGAYHLGRSVSTIEIPATVQAVLAARIDRLPEEEKNLLQTAAVVGRDVSFGVLEAIVDRPIKDLRRGLASLQAAEFLYEASTWPDLEYTFKHALTQEVAYQSLLKESRARRHEAIAQVLEQRFPSLAESRPDLLAHHYTEAGLGARAIPYWHRAGQRASERSAHVEAIAHLTRGLELVAILPVGTERIPQELELQAALAVSLMATQGFGAPEVGRAYARLRELCAHADEPAQVVDAVAGLWAYHLVRADFDSARQLGEELLRLGQRIQDPELLLRAHHALEVTLFRMGEFAGALDHAKRGIALYDPGQHRAHALRHGFDPGANLRIGGAWALWMLGYPDQALRWASDAIALARELGHRHTLAQILYYAARFYQFLREPRTVAKHAEACVAVAEEHRFSFWQADGMKLLGWAVAMQGHHAEGLAHLREGLGAYRTTGALTGVPYDLALLAEVCGQAGLVEEGFAALGEALAIVERTGERNYEAELHRLEGELRLKREEPAEEAESCFRRALDIARRQGARSLELRAASSLARVLAGRDRRDEARTTLGDVYRRFTEGFDTADLRAAETLLKELL